jgi:hypothetical protein
MIKAWYCLFFLIPFVAASQDNYEIQVYASPTMQKGTAIFELHSNYTFKGEQLVKSGVRPSYHSLHETLEITQGVTQNFELGYYIFSNITSPYGWQFVGMHIRPRVAAPLKWKLPLGLSLSAELGFQRKEYAAETWSVELRPIADKQIEKLYLSFNPVFCIQLKGTDNQSAPAFAPCFKAAWAFTKKLSLGTEYYGDLGPVGNFEKGEDQSHAVFAVFDLYLHPDWEINFGSGWGLTNATDGFIFKLLLGRHINWKRQKQAGNAQ